MSLSQKNAVNEYFVHTEAPAGPVDTFWQWYKNRRDSKKAMAHDTNAATDPTATDPTQKLADANVEIERLNFVTDVYAQKMLQHEKEMKEMTARNQKLLEYVDNLEKQVAKLESEAEKSREAYAPQMERLKAFKTKYGRNAIDDEARPVAEREYEPEPYWKYTGY